MKKGDEGEVKRRKSGRKKAHKHKLFALVNIEMALGQTAGCPRVNRAKKFMCSPRNTGNINFSLWLTGELSQGCPGFQKVYVFKVYVPFSCPRKGAREGTRPEAERGGGKNDGERMGGPTRGRDLVKTLLQNLRRTWEKRQT